MYRNCICFRLGHDSGFTISNTFATGLNLATSGHGHVLKGKGNTGLKGAVHTLCSQKCCNSLKAQNINIDYISTSSYPNEYSQDEGCFDIDFCFHFIHHNLDRKLHHLQERSSSN